jgi:hypothetical protein
MRFLVARGCPRRNNLYRQMRVAVYAGKAALLSN